MSPHRVLVFAHPDGEANIAVSPRVTRFKGRRRQWTGQVGGVRRCRGLGLGSAGPGACGDCSLG
eukprot:15355650-Alexandrium_andersonii.AAC.1